MTGLYLHTPFCLSKCNYCDFLSFNNQSARADYIEAMLKEIEVKAQGETLATIYFGGGTPSILPILDIEALMQKVRANFKIEQGAEITFEVNPATVDREYLLALLNLGINRLSIGVQSFCDIELQAMGRRHTSNEAIEVVLMAKEVGFTNISLDLIYGLPNQTLQIWQENLQKAIDLPITHISFYGLELDNDSTWGKAGVQAYDEDLMADMYEFGVEFLAKNGFNRYEISNFAKDNCYSRHNLAYWDREDYLAIGLGASSLIEGKRGVNENNLTSYLLNPLAYAEIIELTPDDVITEAIFLGLRKGAGIDLDELQAKYNFDFAENFKEEFRELVDNGLLEQKNSSYCLTNKGFLLGNQVFVKFLK